MAGCGCKCLRFPYAHGTAYPYPVVLPDDTILVTTGQGEGRLVVVAIDPAWLYQTTQRANLDGENMPAEWSVFGCRGVSMRRLGDVHALHVERTDAAWPPVDVGLPGRVATRAVEGEGVLTVAAENWHTVEVRWDCDARQVSATVIHGDSIQLPIRRMGDGVCYLRLKPVDPQVGPGFDVAAVEMEVEATLPQPR